MNFPDGPVHNRVHISPDDIQVFRFKTRNIRNAIKSMRQSFYIIISQIFPANRSSGRSDIDQPAGFAQPYGNSLGTVFKTKPANRNRFQICLLYTSRCV